MTKDPTDSLWLVSELSPRRRTPPQQPCNPACHAPAKTFTSTELGDSLCIRLGLLHPRDGRGYSARSVFSIRARLADSEAAERKVRGGQTAVVVSSLSWPCHHLPLFSQGWETNSTVYELQRAHWSATHRASCVRSARPYTFLAQEPSSVSSFAPLTQRASGRDIWIRDRRAANPPKVLYCVLRNCVRIVRTGLRFNRGQGARRRTSTQITVCPTVVALLRNPRTENKESMEGRWRRVRARGRRVEQSSARSPVSLLASWSRLTLYDLQQPARLKNKTCIPLDRTGSSQCLLRCEVG